MISQVRHEDDGQRAEAEQRQEQLGCDLPRPRAMSLIGRMCHALSDLKELGIDSTGAA
jgi:hypothetical protein